MERKQRKKNRKWSECDSLERHNYRDKRHKNNFSGDFQPAHSSYSSVTVSKKRKRVLRQNSKQPYRQAELATSSTDVQVSSGQEEQQGNELGILSTCGSSINKTLCFFSF